MAHPTEPVTFDRRNLTRKMMQCYEDSDNEEHEGDPNMLAIMATLEYEMNKKYEALQEDVRMLQQQLAQLKEDHVELRQQLRLAVQKLNTTTTTFTE